MRGVLCAALVNRRLRELRLASSSSVPSHSNVWCLYPPVTFEIENTRQATRSAARSLSAVISSIDGRHLGERAYVSNVSSLLFILHHITELHLIFYDCYSNLTRNVPAAVFGSLQHCKRLRSLELEGNDQMIEDFSPAVALDSLTSLMYNLALGFGWETPGRSRHCDACEVRS